MIPQITVHALDLWLFPALAQELCLLVRDVRMFGTRLAIWAWTPSHSSNTW